MTFLSMLYTLIISPLKLLFEVLFSVANKITGNAGLSIIFLSLAVNLLVWPLYKRADELQKEERDIQAGMAGQIRKIKSAFKGDERFMMLQEYYRIRHYKPVYALKSSISLLLQIPFFIAAYNLLSGMQSLKGLPFGFISDLGRADAMFTIGGFTVNVLPILMTLINIVSGIIYTKGHPLREKIQVYGLAAVFLVLLYNSPSGLVFYWLMNNVFSLLKNIIVKIVSKKKPLVSKAKKRIFAVKKDTVIFLSGTVFLALVTGFLIPSSVMASSPQEFIMTSNTSSPFLYLTDSVLLASGSWILWGSVYYFLMNDRLKAAFGRTVWMICGISAADYLLFGTNLGTLSSTLQYQKTPVFGTGQYILNTLVVIALALALYIAYTKHQKIVKGLLFVGILTVIAIGVFNTVKIARECSRCSSNNTDAYEIPELPLSKDGKNVVVLMLDRSCGALVPYIFNEKPELQDQFDGFTYYPNTISYGPCTNIGSPALYGGYEYTPDRINARSEESLESKQNEALKVMPAIFSKDGYTVTVCDPPCAGYSWIPDLSIYDEYPEINCYNTNGHIDFFEDDDPAGNSSRLNEMRSRNFFCLSLMKISPLVLQKALYNGGHYNEPDSVTANQMFVQTMEGLSKSTGYNMSFIESYPVLEKLPDMTSVNDSTDNTFLMMTFDTTHSPCLLQKPDYVPSISVDNTAYDTDWVSGNVVNGKTMNMTTEEQITHYHVNMATFIKLGEWFDYLREMGVYDNTRIILVSDHGYGLDQYDTWCGNYDMEFFMPLLMVKDFDSEGFTVCEDFMTNGDTPVIATSGLIEDPVNPATGNPITSELKNGPQTVFFSDQWNTYENNGNVFLPGKWYAFDGIDPRDDGSWTFIGEH